MHAIVVEGDEAPEIDLEIAALLHDVLEDTYLDRNTLASLTNARVADLVAVVTDPNLTRRARFPLLVARLTEAMPKYPEALFLKLADRMANVRECVEQEEEGGRLMKMYRKEAVPFQDAMEDLAKMAPVRWRYAASFHALLREHQQLTQWAKAATESIPGKGHKMIKRDLKNDIEHADPFDVAYSDETRTKLLNSPIIWHALWIPPAGLVEHAELSIARGLNLRRGAIVFTGHINCHDCALCPEAGDWRYGGTVVPWRRVYPDCTDPEDADPIEATDDFDWVRDPVASFRPSTREIGALRRALFNPAEGVFKPVGVEVATADRVMVDICWMRSPAASASQLTRFISACDIVGSAVWGGFADQELRARTGQPALLPLDPRVYPLEGWEVAPTVEEETEGTSCTSEEPAVP